MGRCLDALPVSPGQLDDSDVSSDPGSELVDPRLLPGFPGLKTGYPQD